MAPGEGEGSRWGEETCYIEEEILDFIDVIFTSKIVNFIALTVLSRGKELAFLKFLVFFMVILMVGIFLYCGSPMVLASSQSVLPLYTAVLEGMARFLDQLLAPARGFGLCPRLFNDGMAHLGYYCVQ